MADIRIKDLGTTASVTASDDFMAVDGTTNGTRKLSAATPSFATSVTVPGVVAPASTALTLTGGSTGASLVLGASSTGGATLVGGASATSFHRLQAAAIAFGVNTFTKIALGTTNGSVLWLDNGGATSPGVHFYTANNTNFGIDATNSLGLRFVADLNEVAGSVKAVITRTGNLLIGTTTDATSLSGGLVVNGSGAGATSSSTSTGALRVTGGVGVSDKVWIGGAYTSTLSAGLNITGVAIPAITLQSSTATTGRNYFIGSQYSQPGVLTIAGSTTAGGAATNIVANLDSTAGTVTLPQTTASTNTTSGALIVGGGVGVSGAVNVGGAATFAGAVTISKAAGGEMLKLISVGNTPYLTFTDGTYPLTMGVDSTAPSSAAAFINSASASGLRLMTNSTARLTLTDSAATFAGAVSLSTAGTTVSIKSGTNAAAGTVTLVGGNGTITSTAIDANTVIVMSIKTKSGSFDHAPSVVVAAGSATIDGHNSDASTYNWVALKVN
jgi:hypothetical protein